MPRSRPTPEKSRGGKIHRAKRTPTLSAWGARWGRDATTSRLLCCTVPRSASAWAHLRSLVRRNLPCTAASTVKGNLPFVVLVMKQPTTPGSDGGRRTRTADANARCTPAHAIARTPDAHAHAPHHHDHQWQKAAKLLRFGRIANARPQSVPWRSGWNSSKHRRVSEPTTPALRPCMTAIAYTRHSHT